MSMTVEELEKLVTSFQAAAPVVEELISKIEPILDENRKLKAVLDTKEILTKVDKDIFNTLYEQKMINRSIKYSILSDEAHLQDILQVAHEKKDLEIIAFWNKAAKDEK